MGGPRRQARRGAHCGLESGAPGHRAEGADAGGDCGPPSTHADHLARRSEWSELDFRSVIGAHRILGEAGRAMALFEETGLPWPVPCAQGGHAWPWATGYHLPGGGGDEGAPVRLDSADRRPAKVGGLGRYS